MTAPKATSASSAPAPEEGGALKLVVGIALLGMIALLAIEAIECAYRVRRAGGLRAWWRLPHPPQHYNQPGLARANQRKED